MTIFPNTFDRHSIIIWYPTTMCELQRHTSRYSSKFYSHIQMKTTKIHFSPLSRKPSDCVAIKNSKKWTYVDAVSLLLRTGSRVFRRLRPVPSVDATSCPWPTLSSVSSGARNRSFSRIIVFFFFSSFFRIQFIVFVRVAVDK